MIDLMFSFLFSFCDYLCFVFYFFTFIFDGIVHRLSCFFGFWLNLFFFLFFKDLFELWKWEEKNKKKTYLFMFVFLLIVHLICVSIVGMRSKWTKEWEMMEWGKGSYLLRCSFYLFIFFPSNTRKLIFVFFFFSFPLFFTQPKERIMEGQVNQILLMWILWLMIISSLFSQKISCLFSIWIQLHIKHALCSWLRKMIWFIYAIPCLHGLCLMFSW